MPISDKVMLPASFQENFPQALLTRLHSASAGCQANRLFYRHCLSLRTTVGLHIPSLYLFVEICQSKSVRAPKTGSTAAHILDGLGKVCYSAVFLQIFLDFLQPTNYNISVAESR